MAEHLNQISDLWTRPVLRPINYILLVLATIFLATSLTEGSMNFLFTILVALVGPCGMVYTALISIKLEEERAKVSDICFLAALFSGAYSLLIVLNIVDLLGIPITEWLRFLGGIGTLIIVTGILYWHSLRSLNPKEE